MSEAIVATEVAQPANGVPAQGTDTPVDNNIPGAKEGETKAETVARMFKVKIDGQDLEVDEAELLKGYQTGKAATKRMQEAAALKGKVEEVFQLLKTNPRKVLSDPTIGIDVKKFAEEIMLEHMNESILTPEQREAKQIKAKLEAYEEERRQHEQSQEQAAKAQAEAHYVQEWNTQFAEALSTGGLPQTEYTIKLMADMMGTCIRNGMTHVKPSDVIPHVRDHYMNAIREMFGASTDETLLSLLGDDIANKTVKAQMSKVKKPATVTKEVAQAARKAAGGEPVKERKPLTEREWDEKMRARRDEK